MSALTPVSFRKGREHKPRLSPARVPGRVDPRFWSDDEIAVLRATYPKGGAAACAAKLPKRSVQQIYAKANDLRILLERGTGGPRVHMTAGARAALDEAVAEAWPTLSGRGAVQALADRLGVPRPTVSKAAERLGLTAPHRKEPAWTRAETDLLDKAPLHDPRRASDMFRAHGFHRTPAAIMIRATRLGISRRRGDVLSARAAAKILGLDDKTVGILCQNGAIRATRRDTARLPQQGGDIWSIEPADLRRYVLENLERIDIRKVEKFAFVALLVDAPAREAGDA